MKEQKKRFFFLLVLSWFLTGCALSSQWTSYDYNDPSIPKGAQQIAEDDNGNLWFASGNIFRFAKATEHWDNYSASELGLGTARSIAFGSENDIWLGTTDRLGRFLINENRWLTYSINDSLRSNDIRAILLDSTGKLWVGTGGNGVVVSEDYGDSWQSVTVEEGFSNFTVYQIYEDSSHHIWVASGGALFQYDPELDKWATFTDGSPRHNSQTNNWENSPTENAIIVDGLVLSIYESQSGLLWFGTFRGVSQYNPQRNEWTDLVIEPLINQNVPAINGDSEGNIWFGTEDGAVRYDPITLEWMVFDNENGFTNRPVLDIFLDAEGTLWFSTLGRGVYQYNAN